MLSDKITDLRDELARHEDEGQYFTPTAMGAMTALLTGFRALALQLEAGIIARTAAPAALRIAEKLQRQGVTRGVAAQPPVSAALQTIAETIEACYRRGNGLTSTEAIALIAALNRQSACAWSLEQLAEQVTVQPDDEAAAEPAEPSNVVDLFDARRERST